MAANPNPSKTALRVGWTLSILPALFVLSSGVNFMRHADFIKEGMAPFGYPESLMFTLGALEFGCSLIYMIPQTAVLGAILTTGFLGGAVATHVRVGDPTWPAAVIVATLMWLGLYLREPRLRALVPLLSERQR